MASNPPGSSRIAPLRLAPPEVICERHDDGGYSLRCCQPLQQHPPHLLEPLRHFAGVLPDVVFLAERGPRGTWSTRTYAETALQTAALAQGLLDLGIRPGDRVLILSDNSIPQALLTLAAMSIGVVVAPISPAYSLLSQDFLRLRYLTGLTRPSLIFAEDGALYSRALSALAPAVPVVVARQPQPCQVLLETLLNTRSTPQVDEALAGVGPETVAKLLFTSGSTGMPRGVVNTQRMLCANQQALVQLWPFLEETRPVVVDWLPWSHTFGGNHNFNLILTRGGTLYIDHGRPAPGRFDATLQNLRELAPTLYFNAPRGYDMLLPHLEQDSDLRAQFFSRLQMLFYAAAALPQPLWERLERLAVQTRGERIHFFSAWGSTETAPMATAVHFPIARAGVIGLPAPGTELRLIPRSGRLELCVRGPNVMPGYYQDPEGTAQVMDSDGFYHTGDAGHLEDPAHPEQGLVFDGRLSENFKLQTGTWVQVGRLRTAIVDAGSPLIQDAVITGHDRGEVGALLFPNLPACRMLLQGLSGDTDLDSATLLDHPHVRARLLECLEKHNQRQPGSSTRISRAVVLLEPPSIDAGEITDKGYINQRAVCERRAALIEQLYRASPAQGLLGLLLLPQGQASGFAGQDDA